MINQETLISIESLKKHIPFNDSLQYLALFGSRINNTAKPNSALDMFYVCDKDPILIYDAIEKAVLVPGGVKDVIIVPHTLDRFKKIINLYGCAEYYTMRNIHPKEVLYESKSFEYLIKKPNFKENLKEYLDQVKDDIPLAKKLGYEFACMYMLLFPIHCVHIFYIKIQSFCLREI